MFSRNQMTHEGNGFEHTQAIFLVPALSVWNPFLAAALNGNAQAREGFGAIAREWQGFVAARLQEDTKLMQRLTRCRSPNQILHAYADFWHKAADDYGKEITSLTELMTGVTSKAVAASSAAAGEASGEQWRWQRAA
jgi:hypothetical protein